MGKLATAIALMTCLVSGGETPVTPVRDHPVHVVMDVFEAPAAAESTGRSVMRERWPLRFGIPVSRHSKVEDLSEIVVQGTDLAQYRVTARWPGGYVRWLQVDARPDFDPARPSRMLLVTAGEPILAQGELAREEGEGVVVDTGAATFRVGSGLEHEGDSGVSAAFSCVVGNRYLPVVGSGVTIAENGGLRSDVVAGGAHGDDGLSWRTRHAFFRDRALVRIDHVLELDPEAPGPVTVERVVASIGGGATTPGWEGPAWICRRIGGQRLTVVAPTRAPGAEAPRFMGRTVAWNCGDLVPGQRRGFELWLDISEEGVRPEDVAHGVLNPLVARAVENAQYSDTDTMPDPVLAPAVARFYHARNKMDFDATVGPAREPRDALKESLYDGLRDTESPAEHFARSLGLLEEALWLSPEAPVDDSILGLVLHARLLGDPRAADAVVRRIRDLDPSGLWLRVWAERFHDTDEVLRAEMALEGSLETSRLNEELRGFERLMYFHGAVDVLEDAAHQAADLIVRGAWTERGFASRLEVGEDGVRALDPRPTSVDVGAALVQAYVLSGDRPVLERARAHLRQCADATGCVVPVLGDSLRHDVLHLLLNLPITPTWRELPLDVVEARDGSVLVTWTVPDGAERIRVKYSDRPIVIPALDDPIPSPDDVVPFWDAENIEGEPAPAPPGSSQSLRVLGAEKGTVFAARYLDVPQRVRREFERGVATTEVRLPGYVPGQSEAQPSEPSGGLTPLAIAGLALVVILVLFVLYRWSRTTRSA